VVSAIIQGAQAFFDLLADHKIKIHSSGGETADVGDIVRTIDVGYTTFARLPNESLIINNIQAGDVIVGLSSSGQAVYEEEFNSGIGSNGLTSGRHDNLDPKYRKYTETYAPETPLDYVYCGKRVLSEPIALPDGHAMPFGKLLLSPTRTYLPVLKEIYKLNRQDIHAVIHCTGGGQTKVLKFAPSVRIVKNNLFDIPLIFKFIQEQSGTEWKEMYQVYNMGHRMELYTTETTAYKIIEISNSYNIDAAIIGHVESCTERELHIQSPHGSIIYP
jgi:phosphoribosylformylglycinamidine cyclo-ligase